jgi:maleate cis-trans isomerase
MAADGSRGTVGIVRPTQRIGGFQELAAMLPAGIRLVPLCLDVRRGAIDEFKAAIPAYEAKVAEFARMGVDVINPSGAPPFMVLGYASEQELIRRWEATYKTRIFTSGTSNIDALRALKVNRFVGVTYFRGDLNRIYGQYFVDAGFDCLDMAGMDVAFDKVPELPSAQVHRFIADEFAKHRDAEASPSCTPFRSNAGTSNAISASASLSRASAGSSPTCPSARRWRRGWSGPLDAQDSHGTSKAAHDRVTAVDACNTGDRFADGDVVCDHRGPRRRILPRQAGHDPRRLHQRRDL